MLKSWEDRAAGLIPHTDAKVPCPGIRAMMYAWNKDKEAEVRYFGEDRGLEADTMTTHSRDKRDNGTCWDMAVH